MAIVCGAAGMGWRTWVYWLRWSGEAASCGVDVDGGRYPHPSSPGGMAMASVAPDCASIWARSIRSVGRPRSM